MASKKRKRGNQDGVRNFINDVCGNEYSKYSGIVPFSFGEKRNGKKKNILCTLGVGNVYWSFFRFQPSFQLYRPALRGALHRIVKCCRSSDSFSGQKGQHAVCSLWPDGGIGDSGNFKAVFIEKKPLPPAGAKEKTKQEKRL